VVDTDDVDDVAPDADVEVVDPSPAPPEHAVMKTSSSTRATCLIYLKALR
jgi:hypothetical protein